MNPNISYELIIITIKNDVRPLLLGKNVGTVYTVYDKGIRLIHKFSRERQPLHCDVIVGKQ